MYYIKLTEQIKDEIHEIISSLIKDNKITDILEHYNHHNWMPLSNKIEINFGYPEIFMHENIPLMVEFLQVLTPEELFLLFEPELAGYKWNCQYINEWPLSVEYESFESTLGDFYDHGHILNRQEDSINWELTEVGQAIKRTILTVICLLQADFEEPSTCQRVHPEFSFEQYYKNLLNELRVRSKELI